MTSYTWPCVSGTLEKVTCPVYGCKVAYTGQVTIYQVPGKHGYVYLVRLYAAVLAVRVSGVGTFALLTLEVEKCPNTGGGRIIQIYF